jgi:hypothetical protein
MADKKEKLTAQLDEVCDLFQRLQVCPSGVRCQKLHIYEDLENVRIVKSLDVIIGGIKDISERLTVVEKQLKAIVDHLNLNPKDIQERGRNRASQSRRRYARQVKAGSASSDRAKTLSWSSSVHYLCSVSQETPQWIPQYQVVPQQIGDYLQYNPPHYIYSIFR